MLFIVTMHHSPDHCWARPENEEVAEEWIDGMDSRASETGVELHGTYVTPVEHAFYFLLEAEDFESVTAFLGPPLLLDHEAQISPIMPLAEADAALEVPDQRSG